MSLPIRTRGRNRGSAAPHLLAAALVLLSSLAAAAPGARPRLTLDVFPPGPADEVHRWGRVGLPELDPYLQGAPLRFSLVVGNAHAHEYLETSRRRGGILTSPPGWYPPELPLLELGRPWLQSIACELIAADGTLHPLDWSRAADPRIEPHYRLGFEQPGFLVTVPGEVTLSFPAGEAKLSCSALWDQVEVRAPAVVLNLAAPDSPEHWALYFHHLSLNADEDEASYRHAELAVAQEVSLPHVYHNAARRAAAIGRHERAAELDERFLELLDRSIRAGVPGYRKRGSSPL